MKSLRRFVGLWLLALGFSFLLLSWTWMSQKIQTSEKGDYHSREIGFIAFLDRHLLAMKQGVEIGLFPGRYLPSSDITILSLPYSDRADFWFDEEMRKSLGQKLRDYQGTIFSNIEGGRLSRDTNLKLVLQNPNFIRGISFSPGIPSKNGPESFLSEAFLENTPVRAGKLLKVLPEDLDYYQKSFSYGLSMIGVDLNSHFIFSFPLFLRGSRSMLPTNVTAAFMRSQNLSRAKQIDSYSLEFLSDHDTNFSSTKLPVWLPLRFYDSDFKRIQRPEQIEEFSKKTLIIELQDQWGGYRTLHDQRVTWGTIAATALSNLLNDDALLPNAFGNLVLLLICILGCVAIVISSTFRLRSTLLTCLFAFAALLVTDLLLSVGLGFRTHPLEEIFSLFAFTFVGIGTRSILDSEERRMFERALSGYVSEQRLQRLVDGKERLNLEGREITLTTVLFDIAGFSSISKEMGPVQTFALIQKIFARTDPFIFQFGGVIDKQTGDGFLAFFGDEEDDEANEGARVSDAANRACRCALAIQDSLRMDPIFSGAKNSQLIRARIGINTGKMMIGNAGSSLHFNYTVFGQAVNFTQRLEAACPNGSVLIGEETQRLIQSTLEAKEKWIHVKGEAEASLAYELGESRA